MLYVAPFSADAVFLSLGLCILSSYMLSNKLKMQYSNHPNQLNEQ